MRASHRLFSRELRFRLLRLGGGTGVANSGGWSCKQQADAALVVKNQHVSGAISSSEWDYSGGTSGWRISKTGAASFKNQAVLCAYSFTMVNSGSGIHNTDVHIRKRVKNGGSWGAPPPPLSKARG